MYISEAKHGKDKALYHYNCAETLLNSSNDYYNLGLNSKFLKAIVPFGGGFYSERSCGAFTGALPVIGLLFAEDRPTTNDKLKEVTKKWVEIFEKEFGSLECRDIKASHRDEVKGCGPVMLRTAELFEELVAEYK